MAGFYIHIPFCKKVCYYCDFHFVATLKYKDQMVDALLKEINSRKQDWLETTFDTLYFGGGTPSVLSIKEINRLTECVFENYTFLENPEITLEANPDDLTNEYLSDLKTNTKINRLSIGTQSFHDRDLKIMNRRHNGIEAYSSIKAAQDLGFLNLNVDLIYGVPGLSTKDWEQNIHKFLELQVPHLSAYHLTFEPKTVFDHMRKKGQIAPVNEEKSQEHYSLLIEMLKENNFEHYEISNFAKEGFFSNHNNNYWFGKPYLGIGPSAHGFDGKDRYWNVSNNTKYVQSLAEGNNSYFTTEQLTDTDRYNEYVLTSLRTSVGASFSVVQKKFGPNFYQHLLNVLKTFEPDKHYVLTPEGFRLSEEGWLIADYIMREFFYTNQQ